MILDDHVIVIPNLSYFFPAANSNTVAGGNALPTQLLTLHASTAGRSLM